MGLNLIGTIKNQIRFHQDVKMTLKWRQNVVKTTQKWRVNGSIESNWNLKPPKISLDFIKTSKWRQNDAKMTQKWRVNGIESNWNPKTWKWRENDVKMTSGIPIFSPFYIWVHVECQIWKFKMAAATATTTAAAAVGWCPFAVRYCACNCPIVVINGIVTPPLKWPPNMQPIERKYEKIWSIFTRETTWYVSIGRASSFE